MSERRRNEMSSLRGTRNQSNAATNSRKKDYEKRYGEMKHENTKAPAGRSPKTAILEHRKGSK